MKGDVTQVSEIRIRNHEAVTWRLNFPRAPLRCDLTEVNAHVNPSLQMRKVRPGDGQQVESVPGLGTFGPRVQGSHNPGLGCLP